MGLLKQYIYLTETENATETETKTETTIMTCIIMKTCLKYFMETPRDLWEKATIAMVCQFGLCLTYN
jgi:hypothetical protein